MNTVLSTNPPTGLSFGHISPISRYDGTAIQVSCWNSMSGQPDIIIDIRGGGHASTEGR